jgi:hypothetical protein
VQLVGLTAANRRCRRVSARRVAPPIAVHVWSERAATPRRVGPRAAAGPPVVGETGEWRRRAALPRTRAGGTPFSSPWSAVWPALAAGRPPAVAVPRVTLARRVAQWPDGGHDLAFLEVTGALGRASLCWHRKGCRWF